MWKTIRRETGLIEHICPHGIGHPNAGSIQYMEWYWKVYDSFEFDYESMDDKGSLLNQIPVEGPRKSTWGIHGCDGCCGGEDFPGKAVDSIKFALGLYTEEQLMKLRNEYFMLWWGLMAACAEAVPE